MKTTLASKSTTRTNSRRTSVDTVSEAVDVADTVVEARADGSGIAGEESDRGDGEDAELHGEARCLFLDEDEDTWSVSSSFYTFLSLRTATEQIKRAAWLCLASSLPNAHDTVHTASIT